jgi:F-box associated region
MEKIIQDYPKGVRYIKFCHRGEDTQFWAGHYGSKFTAATILIRFEKAVVLEELI